MFFYRKNKKKSPTFTIKQNTQSLSPSLEKNITYLCGAFNDTNDLTMEKITFHGKQGKLIYLETVIDTKEIRQSFLIPLSEAHENDELKDIIVNADFEILTDLKEIITSLLKGSCALVFEGEKKAYLFNAAQKNIREFQEPENEKVVRGSHQGFVEDLDSNINLIRQRIRNRQLMVKYYELGMEVNKKVALIYINDLANPSIVEEVEKRILSISLDTIFTPGYIEECIEEHPFSPFPQNLYTERPDRLEAHLIEGRVAIMSEESADAIITPVTFFSFFQSPDDYNNRFYSGTVFRLLRLFSFWGTLILPPLYIAIVGFHFEIIPFEMVTLVKNSIENVPYPPFLEALLMAVTLELIREAGIRLPTSIGQTIGIVGGLIIGDAVVNAGLVSNIIVIAIALTAIMSFSISTYEVGNTARIFSFPIMIAAAMFGFVGIMAAFIFIIIHMCKLESYGTPYISPLAPLHLRDLKDAIARFPVWMLNRRPKDVHAQKQFKQRESREWTKNDRW